MTDMEQLRSIYAEYDQKAYKVRQDAGLFDGMLGLGNDPRKDHCHKDFYEQLQNWVQQFRLQSPTPDQVFEAVSEILTAADQRRNTDTYWFCYASHGLVSDLVPLMTAEQCTALTELYDKLYPKSERLPVHKALYKQLKKAGR